MSGRSRENVSIGGGSFVATKSLQQIFEKQVVAAPDAIAVCDDIHYWTYAQLNTYSNQIANRLARLNLPPESFAGVCLQRSAKAIAALIGVLKAGLAYVPLDSSYPDTRLQFMLADTDARCVITDEPSVKKLEALKCDCRVIRIEETAGESGVYASQDADVDRLAYVMYTSGSTGSPKGVMIPQRGIIRLVCNPGYINIDASDTFIHIAPLSFDASTFEIWAPLLNGAKLVVPPPQPMSLAFIASALERRRVTTLWLTAGLFHAMVDEYPQSLRNLKYLLAGGDVLSPIHVRRAIEIMTSGHVINGYGPTENTTFTCCHTVSPADAKRASIPIGRPVRGTEVYVLDEQKRLVTGGEVGEIYIGGEGLARGYWNRPELTAERFIPNPFSGNSEDRLYRSGDFGHRNAYGDIEFDGRVDLQVKIRGFRIELAGIEEVVNRLPGVASAAVVVKEANSEAKHLACYFVRQNDAILDPRELELAIRGTLPSYMVPSRFIELNCLPLNPNGKVDRGALSDLDSNSQANPDAIGDGAFDGDSATERELTSMFRLLFHRPAIGVNDNFFELGGNSLLAARLFARIEKQFGKRLPIATILHAPSARHLAAMLAGDDGAVSNGWSPLVPVKASGSLAPLFFVHAVGGNIVGYQPLAAAMMPEQPFYALQAQGLDGEHPPLTSIPQMAATYLSAIREVQPDGPYHLGGFSAGGVIAFEMACQLQQSGEEVASLILIDSSIEMCLKKVANSPYALQHRLPAMISWNWGYLWKVGSSQFLKDKVRNFKMNLRMALRSLYEEMPPYFRRIASGLYLDVEESCRLALKRFNPGILRSGALLLRTPNAELYIVDSALGWKSVLTGALEVENFECGHDSIINPPHVETVARRISAFLGSGQSVDLAAPRS